MAAEKCPRSLYEESEKARLHPLAALSSDAKYASRQHPVDPDLFRTEFHRDYTRVIHSRSFRRLRHKTQVFILAQNDHICTRLEHSLYVASVAVTIARALRLNEDLAAAIAVGHDLGHAPFGHKGEKCLNGLAAEHQVGRFSHELQSLRVVDLVDSAPGKPHKGLNLTFAVRDGIVCHCGELFERTLAPNRAKLLADLSFVEAGKSAPATLEGCIVRWADKIAYLGRDLEDALTVGLLAREDVPTVVLDRLGSTNGAIIASLVSGIVANGIENDSISLGDGLHEAVIALKEFNYSRIYRTEAATQASAQIDRAMRALFECLVAELQKLDGDAAPLKDSKVVCLKVLGQFLEEDIKEWPKEQLPRIVLDYIAGMTDSFFTRSFEELFVPDSIF